MEDALLLGTRKTVIIKKKERKKITSSSWLKLVKKVALEKESSLHHIEIVSSSRVITAAAKQ